jgi:hypothetical protein
MTDARHAFTPQGILEAGGLPAHYRGAARLAGFMPGPGAGHEP